jgi:hypothetical protein
MIHQITTGDVVASCDHCEIEESFDHPEKSRALNDDVQSRLMGDRDTIESSLLGDGWMVSREWQKQICPLCVSQGMTFSKVRDNTGTATFMTISGTTVELPVHPKENQILQVNYLSGHRTKLTYKRYHRAWFETPGEGGKMMVPSQIPTDFYPDGLGNPSDSLDVDALDEVEGLFGG